MLNQDNKYFNRYLTYLDQGGNNIWWSTNSTSNTTTIADLIITGTGIDASCIEEDCIPICSDIIESEQQTIETLTKPQSLIYPIFSYENNRLIIRLNNLSLIDQPNYIENGCIDSTCVEEFGIWTKAITTSTKVDVDNEIYYFIKASFDNYSFAYLYTISLIHQETGEEIVIESNKGLINSTISIEYNIPEGFNIAISITKFNIEEIVTTYKFVDNPLLLRSNFDNNLEWQPLINNVKDILLSIIYILNTELEIEDKDRLVLYKTKQETLINILIQSVISIASNNSSSYSYIKNTTKPISYNEIVTNDNKNIANLTINPAIYKTTNYEVQQEDNVVIILILIALTKLNVNINDSIFIEYTNKVIQLQTYSLKEEVLKLIALTEVYKLNKDIYTLSIATSTLNQINKRYKLEDNCSYIESLNNPNITTESKIYGDILETYVYNKSANIKSYITSEFNYLIDVDNLYLINSPLLLVNKVEDILLLRLFNIELPYFSLNNTNVLEELTNISNTSFIKTDILESIELTKQDVFNTIKLSIPTDFGWLSTETPIQDLIIECISKPIIDLYLHSRYIKDNLLQKEALVRDYLGIINNKEELLLKTFTTDITPIRSSLWPGKYSNSIDLEIKGFYDEFTLQEIDNIKSLGIESNLVSSIDLPNIDNFDLCFNITKLEDFRCQVDINGQLILLSDGQCDLAPPELQILLQENNCPITQESSITDYLLLQSSANVGTYILPTECEESSIPITSPLKVLLLKDNSFYIGGDREPELIYSIPSDYNIINNRVGNTSITSQSSSPNDYIVNVLLINNSGTNYKFVSIKGSVISEVDFVFNFTIDSSYINVTNDYLWFTDLIITIITNDDPDTGQFIGFKDSTIEATSGFVNLKDSTQNLLIDRQTVTLTRNGEEVADFTPIQTATTPTLIADSNIVIFTVGSLSDRLDLTGGTSAAILAVNPEQSHTLFSAYARGFGLEFYIDSSLTYTYNSYFIPTPDGDIDPRVYDLNLKDTQFTVVKQVDTLLNKAKYYVGNFDTSIICSNLIEVDYIPFDNSYTVISASINN